MSDAMWGLIGVLVGAGISTVVTLWATQWQAKEQLRQQRMETLDSTAARAQEVCLGITLGDEPERPLTPAEEREFARAVLSLYVRARRLAPDLSQMALDAGMASGHTTAMATAVLWKVNGWLRDPQQSAKAAVTFDDALAMARAGVQPNLETQERELRRRQ